MKKILISFFAAAALWGCSKNGGDGPASEIELPFDEEQAITLDNADPSTKIAFTTNAAWTVSLSETRSESQWLTVSPMQGEAGNAELDIVAESNTTASARTMYVTITAGSGSNKTTKTVTIEQDAKSSSIAIETVLINAAGQEFWMGPQTSIEDERLDYNHPTGYPSVRNEFKHKVKLTRNFRMGKYEVTNTQYAEFLNKAGIKGTEEGGVMVAKAVTNYTTRTLLKEQPLNTRDERYNHGLFWSESQQKWAPRSGDHANKPVTSVSWWGAKAFADYVGGALPTEAQWEFAARCATSTMYFFGNIKTDYDIEGLSEQKPLYNCAWFGMVLSDFTSYQLSAAGIDPAQTGGPVHTVGLKAGSPWGLYDIYGNASEWCSDYYGRYYGAASLAELEAATMTDPAGPASSTEGYRIQRGGSYPLSYFGLRSAARMYDEAYRTSTDVGFRVIFME